MTTPPPTVWPAFRARNAHGLIRFLVDALGFAEVLVVPDGAGGVAHAELAWPPGGGVMLGSVRDDPDDGWPARPGTAAAYLVTADVDALHVRAVAAGAVSVREPNDPPHGGRESSLRDPEGNLWSLGTYRGAPRRT
ncbi:VOC family protein [uncultured Modestobacter sp.]|uniref:VOC family protein n=1 Tax=uncultured Modestobacter sp. TaxID=380048 RepID=UPI0026096DA3|nr:VOC family protein [uncultured Modestobacter sp.]